MAYKIVSTIENYENYYVTVPASWENKGLLSWPDNLQLKDIDKLRANPKSIPGENWKKTTCILKAQAETYLEGLQLEKVYSNFTDTEAENRHMQNKLLNKRTRKPRSIFTEKEIDFNELFDNSKKDEVEVLTITPDYENHVLEASTSKNVILLSEEEVLYDSVSEDFSLKTPEVNSVLQDNESAHCSITNKLNNLQNYLESQNKIMNKFMVETNVKLDKLLRLYGENNDVGTSANLNILTIIKEPLKDVEEVQNLNRKLATDIEFKSLLISQLSRIGGNTKTADGGKLIYKLIDLLFHPALLVKFSWTGSSKSKENKTSFQKYTEIIDVLFEVISMADCRHSKSRNEAFLRDKILKHSTQRLGRKRKNEKPIEEIVDNNIAE